MANNIPTVTSQIPRDLQQFVQRVREALDGGGPEAVVTARQLIAAGIVSSSTNGDLVASVATSSSVQNPSAPSNLTATGALASIVVTWAGPFYNGHAYTEIWAHTSNTIGDAVIVGMTAGNTFSHNIGSAATRYYWVRNVNQNGAVSAFNATNGITATTSTDPAYILSLLADEITTSELSSTLASRIDLVDGSASLTNSVASRIANEATSRATAIAAEATARAAAIASEATSRAAAIASEASTRQSAIDVLAASVSDITGTEAYNNSETYALNDLVVYNNNLYKAKQSTSGNLPTVTTHWDLVGNYSSLGDVVVANSAALTTLDTRVTNAEGVNTSQATSLTSLNSNIAATDTNVANNTSAISGLDTRVTNAEGVNTSQATSITSLNSNLATTDTNVANNTSALSSLDTRVTNAEGVNTSQATSITSLNSTVAGHTSGLALNTSALSSLGTRVTATENDISAQSGQITSLQTSIADITGVSAYVNGTSYATGDYVQYNNKLYEAKQATTGNLPTNTTYWLLLGNFTSITGLVSANTAAVSSLDTRVTSAEGSITSQANSITSLTTTSASQGSALATNTSAISGLDTRVTTAEGNITTHTSDITSLNTSVTNANAGIATNVSAISGLDTRVTTAEGNITTHTSDITSLNTSVTNANAGIATNVSAISGLDTRVTGVQSSITSQASDITALTLAMTATETATTANATAVAGLDTRVTSAEGSITSIASDVSTLETEMAATETATTANANATTALTTRVASAEASITSNASDITTLTSGLASSNTNISSNTTAVTALATRVTSAEGSITSIASDVSTLNAEMTATETATTANATAAAGLNTRLTTAEGDITSNANSITSLTSGLTTANTNITSNASALTSLTTRVTSAEGSITSTASSLTQLTTTVGGHTTSIATNVSSINGIEGKFTVKIDTAGHVSGYGLISTANNGTPTSEFGVRADTFWVSPPSNSSASAPTSGLYKGYVWYDSANNVTKYYTGSAFSTTPQTVPFVIKSTAGTVNGVTVPAGVYMDTAMIGDATISNAQIGSLTADKITTSLLSTVDFYGNKIAGSTIYLGGTVNYTTSGGINTGISSVTSPSVILDSNGATFNVDSFRVNNTNGSAFETPFKVANNHVYIKGANIEDASITNAKIEDASVTNAKIGDVIQSDNYSAGSAGWKINKAGEMEMNNATFRGTLDVANASTGQRLAIDGDSIKVFDANNTLRVQIGDLS